VRKRGERPVISAPNGIYLTGGLINNTKCESGLAHGIGRNVCSDGCETHCEGDIEDTNASERIPVMIQNRCELIPYIPIMQRSSIKEIEMW